MSAAERPIRVLHIIGGLGMGGVETWLMELMRHWRRVGARVSTDLLLTGGAPDLFDREARAMGARLHYLRYSRREIASFVRGFRRILQQGNYDALHDHGDYSAGWRLAMGGGLLPPVRICHVHNPMLHIEANYAVTPSRRAAAKLGQSLVKRLATHACGTSRQILEQYGFIPGERGRLQVRALHCGIDVGKFASAIGSERSEVLSELGWPSDAKVVLFAGRLDRHLQLDHPTNHKNSWLALNIMREAHRHDDRVRLIMAGGGESKSELERHIAEWGLSDELRLVGIRSDMPRLMHAADALLFPSRQEGLGMVAVEAQASGLPVLASASVPREAMVVPELFEAIALDQPISVWVDTLLAILRRGRPPASRHRHALLASDFNIENSARAAERIYLQA